MSRKNKNIFLDTNALIYLYQIEFKKNRTKMYVDGVPLLESDYINYLKNNGKILIFCSDSYYEFICHCFKNNCEKDFLEFYNFINSFCKENYKSLPLIIGTEDYYKFDTNKFALDFDNNKVDYKSYVNERVMAEVKLLKNLYIPIISTIKELLKKKYPTIELYEENDGEMVELLDNCTKDMFLDYYTKKDSDLDGNKCVNIPVGIVIEKYCNINHCNYTTVSQMLENQNNFDICRCIKFFLEEVLKPKGQNYKISHKTFYDAFCETTKQCRKRSDEIVLYDYIDYLTKEMLFKTNRKLRKNDIVDMSIISTIFINLNNFTDCEDNVFINFDKNIREFIKEKSVNSQLNNDLYNKLSLFSTKMLNDD